MADTTLIQWADATLNPWGGCTKVSTGCARCYAEHATPIRAQRIGWGRGAPRHRFTGFEANALRLDRRAAKSGRSLRVFPSLCDWLDAEVPAAWLADFLDVIRRTPHLTWILLTKRPELWRERLDAAYRHKHLYGFGPEDRHYLTSVMADRWRDGQPPANVWFVFSAEDQANFDHRARAALAVPAVLRGVSLEPLLGPVDVRDWLGPAMLPSIHGLGNLPRDGLGWVITGGESAEPGDEPRRCEVFWIWEIIRACRTTGTPCFVKQLGGYCTTGNANAHDWPEETVFCLDDSSDGAAAARVRLSHPKGGDPAEWPEEMHVRQWPASRLPSPVSLSPLS